MSSLGMGLRSLWKACPGCQKTRTAIGMCARFGSRLVQTAIVLDTSAFVCKKRGRWKASCMHAKQRTMLLEQASPHAALPLQEDVESKWHASKAEEDEDGKWHAHEAEVHAAVAEVAVQRDQLQQQLQASQQQLEQLQSEVAGASMVLFKKAAGTGAVRGSRHAIDLRRSKCGQKEQVCHWSCVSEEQQHKTAGRRPHLRSIGRPHLSKHGLRFLHCKEHDVEFIALLSAHLKGHLAHWTHCAPACMHYRPSNKLSALMHLQMLSAHVQHEVVHPPVIISADSANENLWWKSLNGGHCRHGRVPGHRYLGGRLDPLAATLSFSPHSKKHGARPAWPPAVHHKYSTRWEACLATKESEVANLTAALGELTYESEVAERLRREARLAQGRTVMHPYGPLEGLYAFFCFAICRIKPFKAAKQ
eukprot:1160533-Pelagomonas_calceolata.AAC.25